MEVSNVSQQTSSLAVSKAENTANNTNQIKPINISEAPAREVVSTPTPEPALNTETQSVVIETAPRPSSQEEVAVQTQKSYAEVENKSAVEVEDSKVDIAV